MYYFGGHIPREKGKLVNTLQKLFDAGGNTLQIFVGNPYGSKLNKKDYLDQGEEVKAFLKAHHGRIFIHSSYTLNFAKSASDEKPYWIDALWEELQIADALGADGCVLHMGKAVKRDLADAQTNMVENLKVVIGRMMKHNTKARIFVETSAGQGSELYPTRDNSIQPLKEFYSRFTSEEKKHIAFCVDTCHIFAAGYDIRTPQQVDAFFKTWREEMGIKTLAVVHLNNSVKDLGSSVDRHACLAYGKIPIEALATFTAHSYYHGIPVILETPAPLEEVAYLVQTAERMGAPSKGGGASHETHGKQLAIQLPPSSSDPVLIVDCGYLMFYRYHATKRSLVFKLKRDPTHEEILEAYSTHLEEQLKKTLKKTKAKLVLFCKDTSRAQLWRTQIWPEYKLTRGESSEEMIQCFKAMDPIIQKYGTVLKVARLEADDMAALSFKYIEQVRPDQQVIFLTVDRDYLQLLRNPHVKIIDAAFKEIKGSGDHEVDLMVKILTGDKSDNIPAVCAKCGPKTADGLAKDEAKLQKFIADKKCQEAFDRNRLLVSFDRIPADLEGEFKATVTFVV